MLLRWTRATEGGSKMRGQGMAAALAPSDLALFGDPEWMKEAVAAFSAMFAQGLEGYTDDRLADGPGWVTFDVSAIRCPVTVLHGGSDRIVDVIHAHHTAELVPNADLVIFDGLGHFSIATKVVPAISSLLQRLAVQDSETRQCHRAGNASRPASASRHSGAVADGHLRPGCDLRDDP